MYVDGARHAPGGERLELLIVATGGPDRSGHAGGSIARRRRGPFGYFMYYNFARVHLTLRVTPAMEAGIADHVWSIEEIVALLG
jgi:hypothetical protein